MAGIRDQNNIDELNQRLYDRAGQTGSFSRHSLTKQTIAVSRGWDGVGQHDITNEKNANKKNSTSSENQINDSVVADKATTTDTAAAGADKEKPRRRYRSIILLVSIVLFVVSTSAASVYLFFGNNQISVRNINLSLVVPMVVSGGEVTELQVGITNQNEVAVRSALLIVNYPPGTRSANEERRELFEERLPIADIPAGGAITVPLKAVFYGEENQEKEVSVSLQYRVDGSNGIFEKNIDPQKITIGSSPVMVRFNGAEKVSSGQELELVLEVRSNTSAAQRNLLVTVSYPDSFRFLAATPAPTFAPNSWMIEELPANGTKEIRLRGLVEGFTGESAAVSVQVGTPQLGNQFLLGAVLTQGTFGYSIEDPFTGVTVAVNDDADGSVVLSPDKRAEVTVTVKNILPQSIYDLRVNIKPTGNLIRDDLLSIETGFYDAREQVIRFDARGDSRLAEVRSGETRDFTFSVRPDSRQQNASFAVSVELFAKRVGEPSAAESLIGTGLAEVKYSSIPTVSSQLSYGGGQFADTGPIPPVAGETTTYTATLVATAGVNSLRETVVATRLPQHVTWLDEYNGAGRIEFNPVNNELSWRVGEVEAGTSKEIEFQVALLPSVTQVGEAVTVVGAKELRATDGFTGVALRAMGQSLTSRLSAELGFTESDGIVEAATN